MSQFVRVLRDPKLLVVLLLGFSSGLPFLLVGGTLKAWLARAGVDLGVVGFFAFVRVPYTWKLIWSPVFDRYQILNLGRRRGWLLVSQAGLFLSLVGFTLSDPQARLWPIAVCALLTSFFSASQDIVIDAYRREILPTEELGLGSSLGVLGYRFGTMLASGGAFLMADHMSWQTVYFIMALCLGVGIVTAVFAPEPETDLPPPRTLRESVLGPLKEFFGREGSLTILAFVFLYKIGESLANEMYSPFYIQLGFTNTEIGAVTKIFAVWAMIAGGVVGGLALVRLKIYRSLWIFGILQAAALLLFTVLAGKGHDVTWLAIAIGSEYFASGMATSAFVAFLASQTDRRFTAVQYALLSSLGVALPSVLLGSVSGYAALALGWPLYFTVCALFTLPGLLILFRLKPLVPEI